MPREEEEIDEGREGHAVAGDGITENESAEAPAEDRAEKPAAPDAQNDAVEERKDERQARRTDAVEETVRAAHENEPRELPDDRPCEERREGQHLRVVREDAEQAFRHAQQEGREYTVEAQREKPAVGDDLPDAVRLAGPEVLPDHARHRHHDALRHFRHEVVELHADAEDGRGGDADAVHESDDVEHADVDRGEPDDERKTQPQHGGEDPLPDAETFAAEVEAEFVAVPVEVGRRVGETDGLSEDRRQRRAEASPSESRDEQKVEEDVRHARDGDENERMPRVAHAAQYGRYHVVSVREDESRAANDEVGHRAAVRLPGHLEQIEDRAGEDDAERRHAETDQREKREERPDRIVEILLPALAQELGDIDLSARREPEADHREERADAVGVRDGGKPVLPHDLAHDEQVHRRVQHLQCVRQHERNRKPHERTPDGARREIPDESIRGHAGDSSRVDRNPRILPKSCRPVFRRAFCGPRLSGRIFSACGPRRPFPGGRPAPGQVRGPRWPCSPSARSAGTGSRPSFAGSRGTCP